MMDVKIGKTIGLMTKTLPFIIFRLLMYLGVAFGVMLVTGVGVAVGYMVTSGAETPGSGAGVGGLIGFGLAAGVLFWLREYILYLVKAGHIAVLVGLSQKPQWSCHFESRRFLSG